MTEPILLQFIEKVYKPNVNYCVICLRTSQERRLEKPVYLKKFIQNVSSLDKNNQCFVFRRIQQLVCFVCERQAAAAARFLAALGLASHAHAAVQRLLHSPGLRNQLYTGYQQYIRSEPKQDLSKCSSESLLLLETKLRQQRVNSQLLLTEVLIVSTPSTADCPPDPLSSDCEVTSGPGDSRNMYVLPDLLPATDREEQTSDALDMKTEVEIKLEPILICDDDDPLETQPSLPTHTATGMTAPVPIAPRIGMTAPAPIPIAPRMGMTAPAPIPIAPRIGMTAPGPKSIGLGKGTTTPIIQPNKTSNQTTESRLESDSRVAPIGQVLESTGSALILSTPNFILHPLVFNSGMMTVPSLGASILEGQLVTSVQNTLTFETPELAFQNENSIDFIVEPEKVTSILKKISHHEASKVFIFKPMRAVPVSADPNLNPPNLNPPNLNPPNLNPPNLHPPNLHPPNLNPPNLDQNAKKIGTLNSNATKKRADSAKTAPICAVGEARSLESEERDGINTSDSGGRTHSDERNGDRESEAPRLRSYRIDWEDKIPMDVISFVDEAETTCKRSRRSDDQPPPLGISNVTSLSKADAASQADDIIDLC